MRRGHGSSKVPNVKLKPVPVRKDKGKEKEDSRTEEEDEEEEIHAEVDANRPLVGMIICATGIKDKVSLFQSILQLGGKTATDFTDTTTHLIAEDYGSAKYNCALERSVPILQPSFISATQNAFRAGIPIILPNLIETHRLPPFLNTTLCLSGIADPDLRPKMHKIISLMGGEYAKHLGAEATHLICGSDDSDKIRWAVNKNQASGLKPGMKGWIWVVWEEWFWDCCEFGGRWPEMPYQISKPRPTRKVLAPPPPSRPKRVKPRRSTSAVASSSGAATSSAIPRSISISVLQQPTHDNDPAQRERISVGNRSKAEAVAKKKANWASVMKSTKQGAAAVLRMSQQQPGGVVATGSEDASNFANPDDFEGSAFPAARSPDGETSFGNMAFGTPRKPRGPTGDKATDRLLDEEKEVMWNASPHKNNRAWKKRAPSKIPFAEGESGRVDALLVAEREERPAGAGAERKGKRKVSPVVDEPPKRSAGMSNGPAAATTGTTFLSRVNSRSAAFGADDDDDVNTTGAGPKKRRQEFAQMIQAQASSSTSGGVATGGPPAPPAVLKSKEIFGGARIRLVGDAASALVVRTLEACGAVVNVVRDLVGVGGLDEGTDEGNEVDYIVVRLARGCPYPPSSLSTATGPTYWSAVDPRPGKYRTDYWVERCIYEERICPVEDHAMYRPLEVSVPLPGAHALLVCFSGLDPADQIWLTRLLRVLGAGMTPPFTRQTTHLICPSAQGAKYEMARKLGTPVVRMEWALECARVGGVVGVEGWEVEGSSAADDNAMVDLGADLVDDPPVALAVRDDRMDIDPGADKFATKKPRDPDHSLPTPAPSSSAEQGQPRLRTSQAIRRARTAGGEELSGSGFGKPAKGILDNSVGAPPLTKAKTIGGPAFPKAKSSADVGRGELDQPTWTILAPQLTLSPLPLEPSHSGPDDKRERLAMSPVSPSPAVNKRKASRVAVGVGSDIRAEMDVDGVNASTASSSAQVLDIVSSSAGVIPCSSLHYPPPSSTGQVIPSSSPFQPLPSQPFKKSANLSLLQSKRRPVPQRRPSSGSPLSDAPPTPPRYDRPDSEQPPSPYGLVAMDFMGTVMAAGFTTGVETLEISGDGDDNSALQQLPVQLDIGKDESWARGQNGTAEDVEREDEVDELLPSSNELVDKTKAGVQESMETGKAMSASNSNSGSMSASASISRSRASSVTPGAPTSANALSSVAVLRSIGALKRGFSEAEYDPESSGGATSSGGAGGSGSAFASKRSRPPARAKTMAPSSPARPPSPKKKPAARAAGGRKSAALEQSAVAQRVKYQDPLEYAAQVKLEGMLRGGEAQEESLGKTRAGRGTAAVTAAVAAAADTSTAGKTARRKSTRSGGGGGF